MHKSGPGRKRYSARHQYEGLALLCRSQWCFRFLAGHVGLQIARFVLYGKLSEGQVLHRAGTCRALPCSQAGHAESGGCCGCRSVQL